MKQNEVEDDAKRNWSQNSVSYNCLLLYASSKLHDEKKQTKFAFGNSNFRTPQSRIEHQANGERFVRIGVSLPIPSNCAFCGLASYAARDWTWKERNQDREEMLSFPTSHSGAYFSSQTLVFLFHMGIIHYAATSAQGVSSDDGLGFEPCAGNSDQQYSQNMFSNVSLPWMSLFLTYVLECFSNLIVCSRILHVSL